MVTIQLGYSAETVGIQRGYSGDTVRIQRRYSEDFIHYVIFLFPDWSVIFWILFIAAMITSCRNHWDYILNTEALLADPYDHSCRKQGTTPFSSGTAVSISDNSSFKRTYSNGLKHIPFLVGITSS